MRRGAVNRRIRRREAREERGDFQDEHDRAGAEAGPEILASLPGTYRGSAACAAASASAAIGGGAWKSHALNSTAFGTPIARPCNAVMPVIISRGGGCPGRPARYWACASREAMPRSS